MPNFANPDVTRAAEKETQNRIIGLICPFLPPRVFVKCPSIRKMDGRGGGDRTHDPLFDWHNSSFHRVVGGRPSFGRIYRPNYRPYSVSARSARATSK